MCVNTSSSVPSTGYAKDRFLSSIKRHFISRIISCVLGVKRSFLQTGSTGSDSKSENDRQSLPQEAQRFGSEHKELTILDCLVDEVTWDDRRELNRNNQDFLTGKQRKRFPFI